MYEPLLWALAVIHICPKHLQGLQQCCPYSDCRRTSSWLAPRVQPGYCANCNRWLGSPLQAEGNSPVVIGNGEWEWYQWVGEAVGELLGTPPSLSQPPQRENISATIRGVYEVGGSTKHMLARQLQVSSGTLRKWLQGQQIPLLETVIEISFRLELSPLLLLTENALKIPFPQKDKSSKSYTLRPLKRQPRLFDTQSLRLALEMELQKSETPPPSMRVVGLRLHYAPSHLQKRFPELCQASSASYKNYQAMKRAERIQRTSDEIRQAMNHLCELDRYPSKRQVEKLLKHPAVFRQPELTTLWLDTLRMLGLRQ